VDGVTDGLADLQPAEVPRPRETGAAAATRAGEIRPRWDWVEPTVWTKRMLTALEQGVKGGVWFSLIDKVYSPTTLRKAFAKVKANHGAAGVDHQTLAMFESRLDENLDELHRLLKEGRYRPQAVRRKWIPKPGKKQEERPLGIPTVRDRVAQTALRLVMEPIFERDFAEQSYGFRPKRGCKDALRRVTGLLRAGYTWVVDADLKSYFDSIPHGKLMERVRAKVADGRVLALIEAYLQQKVLDGMEEWTPEAGSPQGAVISPLLSNIYLDPLDQHMVRSGIEMVRYADDFVILCRTEGDARAALERVGAWTVEAGLTLHPDKTRIVDATQEGGFDFLGYHFECGRVDPSAKSLRKFKDAVRVETRRTNGHSLTAIVAKLNPKLRGWFEYFKQGLKRWSSRLDGWIRRRLRSILRKRHGGYGISSGREQVRWPNRYFAEQGLFSLREARATACQSATR